MNTITLVEPLVIKRLIKAPRERVFAAWTTPELAEWCCPGERRVISSKVDFRVGGEYNIHVEIADYGDAKCSGIYREIKVPSRIVFTWSLCDCFPEFRGRPTQVTVDFENQKGGTLVTLTHEGLPTSEVREKHLQGWNGSLENLEKLV